MTHANLPPRAVRALAVAGAIGLAASPLMAATAYAAPGTLKVVQPGSNDQGNANSPQITGCSFDLRIIGADKGTYDVTFEAQSPTADIPGVQGAAQVVVSQDKGDATSPYTFIATDPIDVPAQGFHVKANVTSGADKNVSSKVFWVKDCTPAAQAKAAQPAKQDEAAQPAKQDEAAKPARPEAMKPTAQASVPGMVNSGLSGGNGGMVALGLGGAAVATLAALGLRTSARS